MDQDLQGLQSFHRVNSPLSFQDFLAYLLFIALPIMNSVHNFITFVEYMYQNAISPSVISTICPPSKPKHDYTVGTYLPLLIPLSAYIYMYIYAVLQLIQLSIQLLQESLNCIPCVIYLSHMMGFRALSCTELPYSFFFFFFFFWGGGGGSQDVQYRPPIVPRN